MKETVKVSASEFARNFGRYQDRATAGDVVEVTSHGRTIGGFLSARELENYARLKSKERQVWKLADLPDDIVAGIEAAEYGVGAQDAD